MFFKGQTKKIRKTCFIIGGVSFFLLILLSTSYNPILNENVYTPNNEFQNSNAKFKVMESKPTNVLSNSVKSANNNPNSAVTTTSLSYTFSQPYNSQLQNNGAPQAWSSTSLYADNGFLTVGGDGMIFFGNNSFIAPQSTGLGYFTGSAWNGKEFLVVGQKYHPNDGVLMGLYNPANNSINVLSNLFAPSLSSNATLYQTAWNGSNFIILGARPTVNPTYLMLYSFDPVSGSLVNITSILPPSFDSWNSISSAEMLHTPAGIFILIRGQSNSTGLNGEMLGLLASSTFSDLTYYIPSANSVGTLKDGSSPVQNTMTWVNKSLFIANSFSNNSVILFSFNPYTYSVTRYYNQFNGITAFVGSLAYLDGYFYISGYNTTDSYPLMYAFNTNGSLINVLANLSNSLYQTSNWIISSATDGWSTIYITYGSYPNVYFGLITVSGQTTETRFNVIFNETGLRVTDSVEISVGGETQYFNNYLLNNSLYFSEPRGDYFYTIEFPSFYSTVNSTSGWIYVNNTDLVLNEVFVLNKSLAPSNIMFVETGLPSFSYWSLVFNGVLKTSQQGNTIEFSILPGTYTYNIQPYTGYTANPGSGTVYADAQPTIYVQITFTAVQTQPSSIVTLKTAPSFELLPILLSLVTIFYIKRKK